MGELTRPRQLRLADKVTAEGLSQQGVRRTAAVLLVVLGLMGTTSWSFLVVLLMIAVFLILRKST